MSRPPDPSAPLVPPGIDPSAGPDRLLPPAPDREWLDPPRDPSHFAPTADLGGPLLVTPAGSTIVATDGMDDARERASALASSLEHAVGSVRRAAMVPHAPPLAGLDHALRLAADVAGRLAAAIADSAARYSAAEAGALAVLDADAAAVGAMSGGLVAAGILFGVAYGPPLKLLDRLGVTVPRRVGAAAGAYIVAHPQLITSRAFVLAVRELTDGMDEAITTAAGTPPPIAFLLGATGATGVQTSARVLMKEAPRAGLLEESPVDVQRVRTQALATAPVGAAERLDRVPEVDQVRIERYAAPGRADRYVVYVGPTETFSPSPHGEPWDLASNVGGVGGVDVGSIRATELAMRDAGIAPGSEVQLVGFSQGGMVATRIAADGRWNAVGLQTFGAPAGDVALPDGIAGMAVRNREDFIPALAGPQTDHHLLQVERTVYADPATMPTDQAAPGHQRVAYDATADAIDDARSAAVRRTSAGLDAFTGDYTSAPGARITEFTYHAVRRDGTGG